MGWGAVAIAGGKAPVMQPVMQESVVEDAHHESHDQDGGLLVPEQGLEQTPHDEDLSFAKTPSGNAGLRVRLGGLAARGTARCGSRKGSRHAGFRPLRETPTRRGGRGATAYPPHGGLATQRWLSDGKHWGVGAPGGTRTPAIRLRRRRP